jgi:hypothetical protein
MLKQSMQLPGALFHPNWIVGINNPDNSVSLLEVVLPV